MAPAASVTGWARGQTLVVFALTLALLFTGMFALVSDLGALFVTYNRVDSAVLLAVQAGASAIDEGSFYGGGLRLDPSSAVTRCSGSLAEARVHGTCTADAGSVTADARQQVRLPVPLLGLEAPVHVRRTARPAFGGGLVVSTT